MILRLVLGAILCASAALAGNPRLITPADEALLSRGPLVQDVTASSAVFAGKPASNLLAEPVAVTVTPPGGQPVEFTGAFDAAKDTFEIRATNLPAGVRCSYTVRVGGRQTEPFSFWTASTDPSTSFVFAAYGDTRTRPEIHKAVADAIAAHEPRFVLCSGDLVASGPEASQWDPQFFGPGRNLFAQVPVYTTLGNHEQSSINYFNRLALPGNEHYYAITNGPVRVITLDQYQDYGTNSAQWAWADRALAEPFPGWTLALIHEPPFGSHQKRTINPKVIDSLVPLFEKHGVDLVLCGHDHYYMRNVPLAREAGGKAVQYIITGGGGAPLYEHTPASYVAKAESVEHYLVLEASPGELKARVLTPAGREVDAFALSRKEPAKAQSWNAFVLPALVAKELLAAIGAAVWDGRISLTLSNPSDREARATVEWKRDGTAWMIAPDADLTAVVPARGKAVLTAQAMLPETGPFYPTPTIAATLVVPGLEPVKGEGRLAIPNMPEARAGRTAEAPMVDGKLDEACWTAAEALPVRWTIRGTAADATNATTARVVAAPDALVVAVDCRENDMARVRAEAKGAETVAAASDDCVELFIDADNDRRSGVQLVVSVAGATFDTAFTMTDGKAKMSPFEAAWESAVSKSETGWQVEVRVPWAALGLAGVPKPGHAMAFNATRQERNPDPAKAGSWMSELSQWAVTFTGNHVPAKYGTVVFP